MCEIADEAAGRRHYPFANHFDVKRRCTFSSQARASQGRRMQTSLLLVDDEEADLIRFKRAARKAGVKRVVEVCRSGGEAFCLLACKAGKLAANPGYVLVSDLKMPLMMGTELVTRIRKELGLTTLPAFILSSSDSAQDTKEALSSGANGYIVKCESEEDYLEVVRWLDACCGCIEEGLPLTDARRGVGRPPQILAGPVPYGSLH
jgi:CheY-like chemotaxis protein